MTYSGNPASSDRNRIRFLLGDTSGGVATSPTTEFLTDAEIDGVLTLQTNVLLAAADCAEAIAAKKALLIIDHSVLSTSVSLGGSTDAWLRLAERLRAQASRRCTILVGGRTFDQKANLDEDSTLIQPMFKRGMDDNPGSTNVDGSYDD